MEDYRQTKEGKRRFNYPRIYRMTIFWQNILLYFGIAWHNRYSGECTRDFSCCTDSVNRWKRIPPKGREVDKLSDRNRGIMASLTHAVKSGQDIVVVDEDNIDNFCEN